jgi:hypothetical protein
MKVLVTCLPLFAGKTVRFLGWQSDGSDLFIAMDTSIRSSQLRFL